MNNKPKSPQTTETLDLLAKRNEIVAKKRLLEGELKQQNEMFASLSEQQALTVKTLQVNLMIQQDMMRPNRLQNTFVSFDSNEGRFRCQLPNLEDIYDVDGTESSSHAIVAYGDTPQEACDNFDHLWVQGK